MESIQANLTTLRRTSPLVHSITNYVVMNNTANALLAIGASPIMAHALGEVEDMVKIVHSLVVNIGTLDEYWVDGMLLAAKKADEIQKPWILDPVGAGATKLRDETLTKLLAFHPAVIRGNASEILSLAKVNIRSRGVDSANTPEEALEVGKQLAEDLQTIICISGERDFVIGVGKVAELSNGHHLMPKVTGMGCTASALIGAFLGVEKDPFQATLSAMAVMGVAGEIAGEKSSGPGTLQLHFYDALYNLDEKQLTDKLNLRFHE